MWLVPLLVTKETWPPEERPRICVGIAGGPPLSSSSESRGARIAPWNAGPEADHCCRRHRGNVGLVRCVAPFTEPARLFGGTGDVRAVAGEDDSGLQLRIPPGIAALEGKVGDLIRSEA